MTDRDILLKLAEVDPLNVVVRAMLVDELMEADGMTRTEADRKVLHALRTVNDARNLTTAAKLLNDKSPIRQTLVGEVMRVASLPYDEAGKLFLVVGAAPPLVLPYVGLVNSTGFWFDITAGSEWVISTARRSCAAGQWKLWVRRTTKSFLSTESIQ